MKKGEEDKAAAKDRFADNPLFQEVLAEGLAIQDRFSAEPIYARTGKGYLKSVGVREIAEAKSLVRERATGKEDK